MEGILASFDWGAIAGVVALALSGFLYKVHTNLGAALKELTDAAASDSAGGAAITKDEWLKVTSTAMGKNK